METEKKINGEYLGLMIIIIILIVGGIYMWKSQIEKTQKIKTQNSTTTTQNENSIK